MSASGPDRPAVQSVFVPDAGTPPRVEEIGGKGHHLARLRALSHEPDSRFGVPRFVVVRAGAFEELVMRGRPWPANPFEAAARAAAVRSMKLPAAWCAEVGTALDAAGLGTACLAVRSSAADEDSATRSFAGQFDSVLGVSVSTGERAPLWDALRQVWASAFNAHAAAYAGGADAGRPGSAGVRMAVVIQEMVDPLVSGVAFSQDPVSGEADVAVVSAVYGLGEGLVSGELDADTFRVRFAGAIPTGVAATLADKPHAIRLAPTGRTRMEPVAESARRAATLRDDEAQAVAACARRLAAEFGRPQDMEWAFVAARDGTRHLYVLQTRPITTRVAPRTGALPAPAVSTGAVPRPAVAVAPTVAAATSQAATGERRVWDNSNIIESYAGVTTPLTFTFARAVYEDVYRQFCRLMGTPERLIEAHAPVFANMLGLVRGRVYYNLLNWYRTLALLPGFQFNRGFMERMMGVREALESPPEPPGTGSRLRDLLSLVRMVLRMAGESRRLRREVPAFHARVQAALAPLAGQDITAWPAERALALYRRLEHELLGHWRAPLVNDFFAMLWFGVLGKLTERWLPGSPPTLVNDLLCGEGGIVSTEPARRVMELARVASHTIALRSAFAAEPDDAALLAGLERDPTASELVAGIRAYLERFGDRCMEELKLETVTLREDPRFLIGMIRAYVVGGTVDAAAAWERERAIRATAEAAVRAKLGGPARWIYFAVLARTRVRVRDRENLRFERTRVFGVVRRIFLALGRHLAAAGTLQDERDVFYLTREEVFAYFDGTGVTGELSRLVAQRRLEFAGYARETPPPDRFETRGPLAEWRGASVPAAGAPAADAATLRGTGCCPGVVRAPVRVVRDPRQAHDLSGRILVAERTDPGWTLLFPAVKGLLVQRGSLLSHSAIVAREMGLPCVVGIAGLLDTLRDDELVEMDGTTGLVRRLGPGT